MPSRIIRDGLIDSETVAGLHDRTFRLFVHLLLTADDYGLVAICYGPIKRAAPMMDDWSRELVAKMLDELIDAGLLLPYEIDGKRYAAIAKWRSAINSVRPKHPMPPFGMGHVLPPYWYKSRQVRDEALKILKHINAPAVNSGPPAGHQSPTSGALVDLMVKGKRVKGKRVRREKENSPTAAQPSAEAARSGTRPRSGKAEIYSPEFEEAWAEYPRRAGGNPKRRAWVAWKARLREGHTSEEIIAGVKRYAAYIRATGREGTEYVKQAATFFGPDRAFLEPWTGPPSSPRLGLGAEVLRGLL